MPENNNVGQTPPQGGQQPQQPPAGQQKPQGQQPGPVPYDRFKEVLEKAKTLEQRLAEIEAERQKAEEERLKKQEEWKTLAEKYEAELRKTQREKIALKIATEMHLPLALAERLRGETEEEMRADAQSLAELVKTPPAHGVPASGSGSSGAAAPNLADMSPEEIREWAKKNLGMGIV